MYADMGQNNEEDRACKMNMVFASSLISNAVRNGFKPR
jgi:hypothetical protein